MNILFFLTPKADVSYLYDDYSARQAMEKMEYHKYASIPVITRDGKYCYTITEGDILWNLKKRGHLDGDSLEKREMEELYISEFQNHRHYDAVKIGCDMEDIITMAMNQNFVPVVDDNQIFIGIIRRSSIISYCYKQLKKWSAIDKENNS